MTVERLNRIVPLLFALGCTYPAPPVFDAGTEQTGRDASVTVEDGGRNDAGFIYVPTKHVLRWFAAPQTATLLDFGEITVGTSAIREIVFTNEDTSPIHLTGLVAGAQFEVVGATSVTIPPAVINNTTGNVSVGTASVSVRFSPSLLGSKQGVFQRVCSSSSHHHFDRRRQELNTVATRTDLKLAACHTATEPKFVSRRIEMSSPVPYRAFSALCNLQLNHRIHE
jgi:hypothetical protein